MKKIIFTLISLGYLLVSSINLKAQQLTDVITLPESAFSLYLKGNTLYFSNDNTKKKVSKIDITVANPTVTDIATGLKGLPLSVVVKDKFLYLSEAVTDTNRSRISKIDITATNPTVIEVLEMPKLIIPVGIAFKGNDLYLSLRTLTGTNKISKIDITSTNPTITDVITGLDDPGFLVFRNDELYFSEGGSSSGKISKINVTQTSPKKTEVVTGFTVPTGLMIDGNTLYVSEGGNSSNDGKISKINLTATTPTKTEILTKLQGPAGIAHKGNVLYIAQRGVKKISKITIQGLSVGNQFLKNQSFGVYPNPAGNFINISGIKKVESYKVYNLLGEKLLSGSFSKDSSKQIKISSLHEGIYFIKFSNGQTLKFIK